MKTDWAKLISQKMEELSEGKKEFAKRLGVARTTLYYWETGQTTPPLRVRKYLLGEIKLARNSKMEELEERIKEIEAFLGI